MKLLILNAIAGGVVGFCLPAINTWRFWVGMAAFAVALIVVGITAQTR